MNILEHTRGDLVDLGAVSVETHGSAPLGILDTQQGEFYPVTGIQSDD